MKYKEIIKNHQLNGFMEKEKMAYNAKEAQEAKGNGLPADSILVGVITNVVSMKGDKPTQMKDFVEEQYWSKFDGGVDKPAINVEFEVKNPDNEEIVKLKEMFTYIDDNGKTLYTSKSNLGKYKIKYNKLPEAGDQVKVTTNGNGIGKIKLN